MANTEQQKMSAAVADIDGSDLTGIVVLERDLQGDVCIAWSFPNPGEALEGALLAQADFSSGGGGSTFCSSVAHIASEWAYRCAPMCT